MLAINNRCLVNLNLRGDETALQVIDTSPCSGQLGDWNPSQLISSKPATGSVMAPSAINDSNGFGPTIQPLDASLLKTTLLSPGKEPPVPAADDPIRRTQSCTTSHMLTVTWTQKAGWANPEIRPYENFSFPPTTSVLHYGTECFEGLKAYRGTDNRLRLFRPELNCARLRVSSLRGGLPDFDPIELAELIESFLAVDGPRWLPDQGTFLYVRPAIIGTSAALGVSRPSEALLFVIAVLFPQFGQAGPGLKLLCSNGQVRAWPGGFGNAKVNCCPFWKHIR